MFVDFPEVVIIFGVALVVLGPKKLPGVVAEVGRWVGRARAMARQFREQLEQEVTNVQNTVDVKLDDDASSKAATPSAGPETTSSGQEAGEKEAESFSSVDESGMDWRAEYDVDTSLAPYGDPDAIPKPESSDDNQLPLDLDPPGARAAPAPQPAGSQAHSTSPPERPENP